MDILTDYWDQIAPSLGPWWDSLQVWRTVGLSLFAFFIICLLFRRPLGRWLSDERSQKHDAGLFRKSEEFVSDTFLESFLNKQLSERMCQRRDMAQIPRLSEEFGRLGNQFLNDDVRRAFEQLLRTLVRVNLFVAQHFFQNTDEDRLELHPKLIDQRRYEGYVKELNNLISRTWEVYRTYRMTVKQELKV
jgi:hypothetical protein